MNSDLTKRSVRVLLVDDERHIVRLNQVILERRGHKVEIAFDGIEAVEKLLAFDPEVVVLDVMMPYMDGFEVLKLLRRDPRYESLPVIMLTAKAQDKDVFEGYHYGADMYLTKPWVPMELVTYVDRYSMKERPPASRQSQGSGLLEEFLETASPLRQMKMALHEGVKAPVADPAKGQPKENDTRPQNHLTPIQESDLAQTSAEVNLRKTSDPSMSNTDKKLEDLRASIGAITHALKNELGLQAGAVDLIAESNGLTDSDREFIDILRGSIEFTSGFVRRLLEYVHPTSGRPVPVPVCDFLQEAIGVMAPRMKTTIDLEVNLKGCSETAMILVDREQLLSILLELIRNAWKSAMTHHGFVSIIALELQSEIRIVVENSVGPSYQQPEQTKAQLVSKEMGLGIGFELSSQLARNMGGGLAMRDEAPNKKVVTLTVPRSE